MCKTLFSRPSAIARTVVVCVVAAVAIGPLVSPKSSLAQEKRDDSSDAKGELSDFGEAVGDPGAIREVPPSGVQPEGPLAERRDQPGVKQQEQQTQAIDSFVDLLLLARDEQTAKENLETLNAKDWAAVKAEMKELEKDLIGIRQVTKEQFVALTRRMEIFSSLSITPIGVTRDRAYLEVSVSLSSQHRYVAVVTTELAGLPEEAANKLEHAVDKAAFQVRVRAISAKIRKATREYERGDHNVVVRLLEELDKEIDALSVLHPTRKSKWMPGVKKSIVHCLLAASYGKQNEPEKSAKYEALFKEPFRTSGKDVNVERFLRSIRLELDLSDPLDVIDEPRGMMIEAVPSKGKDK